MRTPAIIAALLLCLFLCPTPAPAGDPASQLVGKWEWNHRVRVFHEDGSGVLYGMHTYMDRGKAWEDHIFTWSLDGNILHDHCDEERATLRGHNDNAYEIWFEKGDLFMKHIGSGFESRWSRTEYDPQAHM